MGWKAEAACNDPNIDPNIFFDEDKLPYAKAICRPCPVAQACLRFALEIDVPYGVWGGLDERERDSAAKKIRRQQNRNSFLNSKNKTSINY